MKRYSFGIAIGWVYLVAVLTVAGALWYACSVLIAHGRKIEAAEWQKRENAELVKAQAKIVELNARYRALEHDQAARDVAITEQFEKEVKTGSEKRARVVAAVNAGALRLRVPVAACNETARGVVPVALAGTGLGDGTARAELSRPAIDFFVGLASEADAVVAQLASCQAILRNDRGATP